MEYILGRQLKAAVSVIEAAIVANKSISIFLQGVPGSGKTAFAKYLSHRYGWGLFRYDCNAESNSSLLCQYDIDGIVCQTGAYLKGPAWLAFEQAKPCVLLIDEVDKSPRDFEAFLLRITDEQSFRSPKGESVEAAAPVIFIFSSNGRREMSPEFLRRCMRLTVDYPTGDMLRQIVNKEIPFGKPSPALIDVLCRIAEAMIGKVEPDQLPSPKEIGWCAGALTQVDDASLIEVCFSSFMLKNMTSSEASELVKFNIPKAVKAQIWP